jgi:elongation factor 1-beta
MAMREVQEAHQPLRLPPMRLQGPVGDQVAEVAVTVLLMPESSDVDLDRVETNVKARVKVHSVEREPIAFGLKALRIITVVPDAAGGTDPLEEMLSSIPGVGNVQVVDVRRLL